MYIKKNKEKKMIKMCSSKVLFYPEKDNFSKYGVFP